MTDRRRDGQAGFSLVELLIVSSLFLVVLGATLTSFTTFERNNRDNQRVEDQAEAARTSLDRAARQMRNLARRLNDPVVKRATATDLVFQTSDPSKRWVRYCLQTQPAGTLPASPGRARLWSGYITGSLSADNLGACPGTGAGWKRNIVADYVTNASKVPAIGIFSYTCTATAAAGCPRVTADGSTVDEDASRIKAVRTTLHIDIDPLKMPKELKVSSGVFLRNQNEPPTAMFTWARQSGGRVLLNGSASLDPEARTLRYYYFKGATAPAFSCGSGPPSTSNFLTGVAPVYRFLDGETSAQFTLVVCDAGDLQSLPYGPVTVTP